MLESVKELRGELGVCGCDPDGCLMCEVPRNIRDGLDAVDDEIVKRFMELPVGSDGRPIRIGDELVNDTCTRRATVIGVGAREFFFIDEGRIKKNVVDCWTHVKPDPLRERAKEFLRDYRGLNLKTPDSKLEAILDAFCADVRELMEVD